jgi:hypothetical protein
VVTQTCAAASLGSFAGGRHRAEYNSAPRPQSGSGTSRLLLQHRVGRAICCRGDNLCCWKGDSWGCREVPGVGVVPLSAQNRHLVKELLDVMWKLCARERRR